MTTTSNIQRPKSLQSQKALHNSKSIQTKVGKLKTLLREVDDLRMAANVLEWDQLTYMPPGGSEARGRQLGVLQRLAHEKATRPTLGRLLDDLSAYGESLPYEHDDAALLRVPPSFTSEMVNLTSATYAVWTQARPNNDFAAVKPYLQRILELSRRYVNFFPGYAHPADPLIANSDYGMTVAKIQPIFAQLRQWLTPLVKKLAAAEPIDDSFLYQPYASDAQLAFTEQAIRSYGYDFNRGRQDLTLHPFMIKFSSGDVRITTRVYENYGVSALFSSLHEAGHALYEQNISPAYAGSALAEGASAGAHESQSRLWENIVGRSRPFWQHFYPILQTRFAAQLGNISQERFLGAINKVQPSLIRVEADEVTYNLHIIIRFELELALLEGRLTIDDLPEAWRTRYQEYLGVTPPDDRDGCMQDVHWFGGMIGGSFQGYALGNIMAAQIYEAALKAHPEIPQQIALGDFAALLAWLCQHVYQHGAKFTSDELLERATGRGLDLAPYQSYLQQKYGGV